VVTDRFFERLFPILQQLDEDSATGPLELAMLIPSSVSDNYRSIVLSSHSLDSMGLSQATSLVLSKLRNQLGDDSFKIDSISILRTRESAVRILSESYSIAKLGTAYQAMGMPVSALGLDQDPILFIVRPVSVQVAA
jgi:hypothetical protein